ncbi:hypothetical protein COW77_01420, partial [Candidatus Wolfebacteria bacterium CG18_big_fil_WC_8_21_14_2_50_39_7]
MLRKRKIKKTKSRKRRVKRQLRRKKTKKIRKRIDLNKRHWRPKAASKKFKFDESAIDELIKIGRPRGFVTDTEILSNLPHIENDVLFLEEIYDRLERANIKVVETNQLIEIEKSDVSEKELKEATKIDEISL